MGNSLRCCLACVLPCGALDVIRIVHLNGHVEELTRPISAGEVLKANPNHVISKPSSQGVVRRILILSPETELKRGNIYFLIPSSSLPEKKRKQLKKKIAKTNSSLVPTTVSPTKASQEETEADYKVVDCDKYLSGLLSEKKSSSRRLRKSRSIVWRPHLDSINEDL
ncbi:uncharacterized protein LOC113323197 [Papaver somniferum]|uniref:uncharacterized protein LOC113323197 n=1 Tax=Papaver somniferum TaxID=3469 RepID=UPI000E6F5E19|nr:uncharacterized protein LOC113323197 [Papaver somniferum]